MLKYVTKILSNIASIMMTSKSAEQKVVNTRDFKKIDYSDLSPKSALLLVNSIASSLEEEDYEHFMMYLHEESLEEVAKKCNMNIEWAKHHREKALKEFIGYWKIAYPNGIKV